MKFHPNVPPADPSSDTAPESPAPPSAEAPSPAEPNGDAALVQLQTDLDRFRDLALRSQADFENFRKRAAREKEDAVKYANATFLERLIPILDNFELGLTAARSSAEKSPILAGIEMVAKQLADFLQASGAEALQAEGAVFDPNLHEAVAQEASTEVADGVVIRQLRKGYRLRDRLLRPATVVVSKGAASAE